MKKIAVLGSGTMGHGIAEAFAMKGYPVNLFDINDEVLAAAMAKIEMELGVLCSQNYLSEAQAAEARGNISTFTDLKAATLDRDYVIEAIPEVLAIKQDTLAQLDSWCGPHTIFASNTSSLKLADMIEKVSDERKKRCAINHWFNPAHIVPLVELSDFGNTDKEVYDEIYDMYVRLGKKPAKVLKDVPGLLANRLQQAVLREVFSLIENGVADAESVDNAMKYGPGFRYPLAGPLEIVDLGGADIWYAEACNLLPDMDNATVPSGYLKALWDKNELGVKTGKGFYDYSSIDIDELMKEYNKKLIIQLKTATDNFM